MTSSFNTPEVCYMSVSELDARYPAIATSVLSQAQKEDLLRTAQGFVDSIVGPQPQYKTRQEGQQTVFPRKKDILLVKKAGTWSPMNSLYPCPVSAGDSFEITASGIKNGIMYHAGDYLVSLRTTNACPLGQSHFVIMQDYPKDNCFALIPWGIKEATALFAGALFDTIETNPLGTGAINQTIAPGDSIQIGDFRYTKSQSSGSKNSIYSGHLKEAPFVPEDVASRIKIMLWPYRLRYFPLS